MSDLDRLTIIVSDNAVYKGKQGYTDLDLSDCGIPDDVWAFQWEKGEGWIEFKDSRENQQIIGTDFPEWINKCSQKFDDFDYAYKNPPPPTPEQISAFNESEAKYLLSESDWAALPDTNLQNQAEWDAYRAQLRDIMFNPPQEIIDPWPTKPAAVWS